MQHRRAQRLLTHQQLGLGHSAIRDVDEGAHHLDHLTQCIELWLGVHQQPDEVIGARAKNTHHDMAHRLAGSNRLGHWMARARKIRTIVTHHFPPGIERRLAQQFVLGQAQQVERGPVRFANFRLGALHQHPHRQVAHQVAVTRLAVVQLLLDASLVQRDDGFVLDHENSGPGDGSALCIWRLWVGLRAHTTSLGSTTARHHQANTLNTLGKRPEPRVHLAPGCAKGRQPAFSRARPAPAGGSATAPAVRRCPAPVSRCRCDRVSPSR